MTSDSESDFVVFCLLHGIETEAGKTEDRRQEQGWPKTQMTSDSKSDFFVFCLLSCSLLSI
jgi:hypothetical protein